MFVWIHALLVSKTCTVFASMFGPALNEHVTCMSFIPGPAHVMREISELTRRYVHHDTLTVCINEHIAPFNEDVVKDQGEILNLHWFSVPFSILFWT